MSLSIRLRGLVTAKEHEPSNELRDIQTTKTTKLNTEVLTPIKRYLLTQEAEQHRQSQRKALEAWSARQESELATHYVQHQKDLTEHTKSTMGTIAGSSMMAARATEAQLVDDLVEQTTGIREQHLQLLKHHWVALENGLRFLHEFQGISVASDLAMAKNTKLDLAERQQAWDKNGKIWALISEAASILERASAQLHAYRQQYARDHQLTSMMKQAFQEMDRCLVQELSRVQEALAAIGFKGKQS